MDPAHPPREVGRYLLFDAIAAGGMATVYLARMRGNEGFARIVAMKQLYPHFARDQEFIAMFLDEARISSRIRHPNVVAPLDIIVQGAELFIAMEYVHGEALSTLTSLAKAPLPPPIAGAILMQVLLGLHAAHEATGDGGQPLDIVHRDVSPQNILVGADGLARVVDFGIAKATSRARTTQDGRLKGKLGYMAPEQIRQLPADRRVDVFTAGVVLWELLTGRQLFTGDHPAAVLESILSVRVVPPSEHAPAVPAALDAVVMCALSHDPDSRFDTAKAMATALSQATPIASTLEVSAWVEALAGPGLSAKAARIAEVERASTGEFTGPGEAAPPTSAPPTNGSGSLPASSKAQFERTPAAVQELETDLSLIPSSATHSVRPRSRRRLLWLALGVSAAALALVAIASSLHPTKHENPAQAGAADVDAAALARVTSAAPIPEPPAATPSAHMTVEPQQPLPTIPSNMTKPPHASSTTPRSAGSSRGSRAPKIRPDCNVPYVLDGRGIKRFRPECF